VGGMFHPDLRDWRWTAKTSTSTLQADRICNCSNIAV
jgi:hypothetical protein